MELITQTNSHNLFHTLERIIECTFYYAMIIFNQTFEYANLRRMVEILNDPTQRNISEIMISVGKSSFICGFFIGIILGSNPMVFGIILVVMSIVTINNNEILEALMDQENESNS